MDCQPHFAVSGHAVPCHYDKISFCFGKDFDYFTQEEGGSHDTGHGDIIDKV